MRRDRIRLTNRTKQYMGIKAPKFETYKELVDSYARIGAFDEADRVSNVVYRLEREIREIIQNASDKINEVKNAPEYNVSEDIEGLIVKAYSGLDDYVRDYLKPIVTWVFDMSKLISKQRKAERNNGK